MAELKPCPFCGGEAELWWNGIRQCHEVRCKQCSARGGYCDGMEDAIEAWNKRTERPNGRWVQHCFEIECTNCNGEALRDAFNRYVFSNYCPNCGADMRGTDNDV